jgi:hypothetical protein
LLKHSQNIAKTFKLEGKDAKYWMLFKGVLIKARVVIDDGRGRKPVI